MRDTSERPLVSTGPIAWPSELLERLNVRWPNGPMAGQEPSRVPPPHEAVAPPAAHVAGAFAAARPKPLWQPWSDSDGSLLKITFRFTSNCFNNEISFDSQQMTGIAR